MKKLIPTLVFMMSLVLVNGQSVDRDKALHFLGGNLYGLAGAGIAKQISDGNRYWTFVGAVGGSLLIGLGKEAVDAGQRENGWDNEDLLATVLGGATVGFTIDIFTNRKRNRYGGRRLTVLQTESFDFATKDLSVEIFVHKEGLPHLTTLSLTGSP